ncbi:DUF3368 domain-containing protein [Haloferula sp. A504]|uniref:DUF3368 domain-containing protein n=1 Tax=Haloferula sp. A504 TaxID=3373601 RepID=UPI0031BCF6D0|nr:DUF3368 domain-containing protein [Verrucomicrobiaceae bacterium E54]
MIVITDTSVILNLSCIGKEDLLFLLFGRILAPPEVAAEFQRLAEADPRFLGLSFPGFVEVTSAPSIPESLLSNPRLDMGEIAALALAIETGADLVLMDEQAGRAAAVCLGLAVVGVLGVLIQAKKSGLIREVLPSVRMLEDRAGFWVLPSLLAKVAQLAGESHD